MNHHVGRLELVSTNWFAHPKWSQITISNDIGLVQLPHKINFTETMRPICLPSYSDVDDKFAGLDVNTASVWKKMYSQKKFREINLLVTI